MNSTKLALRMSWITAAILVLLSFHAFLTVWLSSLVGHYTLLRLWPEFLIILLLAGASYILASDKKLRKKLLAFRPAWWIGLYFLVLVVSGLVAISTHHVTAKALWYGWLVDLRYLIFFLITLVVASKSSWLKKQWPRLLLAPAVLVSAFAVLQFWLLPYDFLKHFGYGYQTILPYETINHNLQHLRVASTLRGANPLGAYLLLPISALVSLLITNRKNRWNGVAFAVGLGLALIFSFSRSAWIGATLSLFIISWFSIVNWRIRRFLLIGVAGLTVVGAVLALALHNNSAFQNTFLHTEHNSTIQNSSNEQHSAAFNRAAKDIIHHPLGSGVGTAGPQSFYNNQSTKIAENYYLQVGQEAGILAIGLFALINIAVGLELWRRRADNLSLILLASGVGITFVNLLSHAWADDTLSLIWWGFAGIAIGSTLSKNKLKLNKRNS